VCGISGDKIYVTNPDLICITRFGMSQRDLPRHCNTDTDSDYYASVTSYSTGIKPNNKRNP